ncbi:hypothetical protein BKA70DRAFT_1434819 [Coprinopsis sp. MPI-PUGE-AT-0042]|nr:hypothetical protein BKA70DRAFT_1434819 [Coprinopsis sp. MPI-PUGE-AT-0042]
MMDSSRQTHIDELWSRASSAFLHNFPWEDIIVLDGDAGSVEKAFQARVGGGDSHESRCNNVSDAQGTQAGEHFLLPFIRKFRHFEMTEILPAHGQAHAGTIRALILDHGTEIHTTGTSPLSVAILDSHGISKRPHASVMLCRYLAAMRVIDVGSTLEGQRRHSRVPRWRSNWNPAKNPALALLADVQAILFKARMSLQAFLKPIESTPAADPSSSSTMQALTPPLRIMKELACTLAKTSGCQIVNNILMASLHLSWLLAGNIDIPESFSKANLDHEVLTDFDRAQLSKLFTLSATDSAYKVRLPLFYSLFVSPLLLLRTISVWKQSLDRLHMVSAAIYNGNDKPASVTLVENIIFDAVFGIARGTMTTTSAIQKILNDTPWEVVENASCRGCPLSLLATCPASLPTGTSLELPGAGVPPHGSAGQASKSMAEQPNTTSLLNIPNISLLESFAECIQSAVASTNIATSFPASIVGAVALAAIGMKVDESTLKRLLKDLPTGDQENDVAAAPSRMDDGCTSPRGQIGAVATPPMDRGVSLIPASDHPSKSSFRISEPPTTSPARIASPSLRADLMDIDFLDRRSDDQDTPSSRTSPAMSQLTEMNSGQNPPTDQGSGTNAVDQELAATVELEPEDPSPMPPGGQAPGVSRSVPTTAHQFRSILSPCPEGAVPTATSFGSGDSTVPAKAPDHKVPPAIPPKSPSVPLETNPKKKPLKLPAKPSTTRPTKPPKTVSQGSANPRKRPRKASTGEEEKGTADFDDPDVHRGAVLPAVSITSSGVNLKTATYSKAGSTRDTAIVLDQITDDAKRRLPPQSSARLAVDPSIKAWYTSCTLREWKPLIRSMDLVVRCSAGPPLLSEEDAANFTHWFSAIKSNFRPDINKVDCDLSSDSSEASNLPEEKPLHLSGSRTLCILRYV